MPIVPSLEQIAQIFDDQQVRRLASRAKLPPSADMQCFADGVRDAARGYAIAARRPNHNRLRAEISALYTAATRQQFDQVALLIEDLSGEARELLQQRVRPALESASVVPHSTDRLYRARPCSRVERRLPDSAAFCDPQTCQAACAAVERLCQQGGQYGEGRLRPSGKRSRPTWRPDVYAPSPRRQFYKREAKREFLMLLQFAYLEASGTLPALTARHEQPGPFARFVCECLRLMGASHVDAVELINGQHKKFRKRPVN